jgi:hypothetical protein
MPHFNKDCCNLPKQASRVDEWAGRVLLLAMQASRRCGPADFSESSGAGTPSTAGAAAPFSERLAARCTEVSMDASSVAPIAAFRPLAESAGSRAASSTSMVLLSSPGGGSTLEFGHPRPRAQDFHDGPDNLDGVSWTSAWAGVFDVLRLEIVSWLVISEPVR